MQQKLNIISNCIIPHNIVLLGSLKERSMKNNDWKERLNIVYSTNPDYNYEMKDDEEQATLPPAQQRLRSTAGPQEPGWQSRHSCHRFRGHRL